MSLTWKGESLLILDQRLLPHEEVFVEARTPEEIAEAIRTLQVRGAPAIGIAAAFGMVLAARSVKNPDKVMECLTQTRKLLASTRPTARNLFWALERMIACAERAPRNADLSGLLEKEALAIQQEDYQVCRAIGEYGAALLPDKVSVLTHCNTGALATGGWGTALGIIRSARAQGKEVSVYADETRPLLQGSRLTAWELERGGIPVTILPDSAAGYCMRKGLVDMVIVGADRIAKNGDVVNKVGTYPLALLAREHGLEFLVAAPLSTVDLSLASGEEIPIEERSPEEVLTLSGHLISTGTKAFNPAFDITPARLVSAIICEKGVLRPPFESAWPD
ncbi:MAG: S-methyl-5-thioribose-1-phosphate isomerase [Armatimonadetes bacterium]|nr:S-methyl-5-thioribose-1-phosphate isomerase [Armatimonadota bacterium]NIO75530.1 S-methyl-5-thioribose-1-phosphate isomerase [Armatimonadota bacterium]NIO95907.1 S-methyl-5-thioribose-1-phosphate isomerase [Armatimonadota bacterium]